MLLLLGQYRGTGLIFLLFLPLFLDLTNKQTSAHQRHNPNNTQVVKHEQASIDSFKAEFPEAGLKAIEHASEMAGKVATGAETKEIAIAAVETGVFLISLFFPEVAPFGAVICGLLSVFGESGHDSNPDPNNDPNNHPDPGQDPKVIEEAMKEALKPVMEKLNTLNGALDQLDVHVSELKKYINEVAEQAEFKRHLERVSTLRTLQRRFILDPNQITIDALKDECRKNQMLQLFDWIYNELTTEDILPLRELMMKPNDADMPNLVFYSHKLNTVMANAVLLHATCMGAASTNQSLVSQTLDSDRKRFEEVTTVYRRFLYQSSKKIKADALELGKTEAEKLVKWNTDKSIDDVLNLLVDHLTTKYPWRRWAVYVWGGDADSANNCYAYVTSSTSIWFWDGGYEFGKRVVVASMAAGSPNTTDLIREYYAQLGPPSDQQMAMKEVEALKERIGANSVVSVYRKGWCGLNWHDPGWLIEVPSRADPLRIVFVPYDRIVTPTSNSSSSLGEVCSYGHTCDPDLHCCGEDGNQCCSDFN